MTRNTIRTLFLASTMLAGGSAMIGCQPSGKIGAVATEAENKGSVTVAPGEDVEIKLPENPSTGYTWQRTSELGLNVLAEVSSTFERADAAKGQVGVGGTRIFRYHAIMKGMNTLQYVLVPPGQKPSASDKSYTISVEVKK